MEPRKGPFHVEQGLSEIAAYFRLPSQTTRKLTRYRALLDQARGLGLVGFPPESSLENLARALLLAGFLLDGEVIDVGSGAGLPGIPLACWGRRVVLVEPKRRAAAFCEKAIRELDLDAEVVIATAQEAAREGLRAPNVVARALAAPTAALELCVPLAAAPGRVLLTGGPAAKAPGGMRSEKAEGPLDIVQTILMMDIPSPAPADSPPERPT